MIETSYILGWLAAALLVLTFGLRSNRGLMLPQWLDRAKPAKRVSEGTSRLLMTALGLSAVAAVLALLGRMFG